MTSKRRFFLYLFNFASAVFYKAFFLCFELFFQQHLTGVRHVHELCDCLVFCLVENLYLSNGAHSFTKPGVVWITGSVLYGITSA